MNLRAPIFEATIPGRPVVKKNTQRIVRHGGKTFAVYSKLFSAYRTRALFEFKQARVALGLTLAGELHASYTFHFKNRQGEADVSNLIEAPQDCLAESLIIQNDKQIMSLDAQKIYDGTEKSVVRLYEIRNQGGVA